MQRKKEPRRIKKVPCVLCAKETLDVDRVCWECRETYKNGKIHAATLAEKRAQGELVVTKMPNYLMLYPGSYVGEVPHSYYEPGKELQKHLIDLIGPEPLTTTYYSGESIEVGYTKQQGRDSGRIYLHMTAHSAATADKLIETVRCLNAIAYQEGKRDGESLLIKLANNELPLSKVNKL